MLIRLNERLFPSAPGFFQLCPHNKSPKQGRCLQGIGFRAPRFWKTCGWSRLIPCFLASEPKKLNNIIEWRTQTKMKTLGGIL
jgi:hypothetical protein